MLRALFLIVVGLSHGATADEFARLSPPTITESGVCDATGAPEFVWAYKVPNSELWPMPKLFSDSVRIRRREDVETIDFGDLENLPTGYNLDVELTVCGVAPNLQPVSIEWSIDEKWNGHSIRGRGTRDLANSPLYLLYRYEPDVDPFEVQLIVYTRVDISVTRLKDGKTHTSTISELSTGSHVAGQWFLSHLGERQ